MQLSTRRVPFSIWETIGEKIEKKSVIRWAVTRHNSICSGQREVVAYLHLGTGCNYSVYRRAKDRAAFVAKIDGARATDDCGKHSTFNESYCRPTSVPMTRPTLLAVGFHGISATSERTGKRSRRFVLRRTHRRHVRYSAVFRKSFGKHFCHTPCNAARLRCTRKRAV